MKERYGQTRRIKRQLDQTGIPYSVVHYTDQMYTVERFVEKNIAAGFLPDSVADANPNIVGIEYKDMKPVVVEIFWKKGKYQFEATKRFIALVKEKYPR